MLNTKNDEILVHDHCILYCLYVYTDKSGIIQLPERSIVFPVLAAEERNIPS